jgi:phosphoenolpyruvate synthase/pyruvate phosphate dikinase
MNAGMTAGLAVSPGRGAGRVRLIRDESDLATVSPGDVLVCASARARWLPRVGQAAAIIAETGGALSAAATIAREMAIPFVVVEDACALLRPGQWVEVIGTTGDIRLTQAA